MLSALDSSFPILNPESTRWRASLLQNGNPVENYLFPSASFGLSFHVCACAKALPTVATETSETSWEAFVRGPQRASANCSTSH